MTFTNSGMIDFCDNAIQSLRMTGMNDEILVGCTDKESFDYYNNIQNIEGIIPLDSNFVNCDNEYNDWGTVGFRKVTQNKFPTIKKILETDDVLYFDCDVYFHKNINELVDSFDSDENEEDIFVQSDADAFRRGFGTAFCTGFLLMKSNENVRGFVENVIALNDAEQAKGNHRCGDQISFIETFLRNNVTEISLKVLSSNIYPNGSCIKHNLYDKENYVMGHANYCVGLTEKRNMLKSINGWVLSSIKEEV